MSKSTHNNVYLAPHDEPVQTVILVDMKTPVCLLLIAITINASAQPTKKQTQNMENQNYTTSLLVDQSPEVVFKAVNNVKGWWSEQIDGRTDELNAEFDYHYKDVHRCKLRITEFVPGKKVVWLVLDNHFNFTKDATEWKGTRIVFEITEKDGKTQLTFTHIGLVPAYECYKICSDAWGNYIGGSLKALIETGKGKPNPYIPAIESAKAMKGESHD